MIEHRRGGYCYEHGLLFAAALGRLGFAVNRRLARIGGETARPRHRSHMVLQVHAGQQRWLVDVGFGSGLLEPLPLEPEGSWTQDGWTFALASPQPGTWHLRERHGAEWKTLYSFTEETQHASDVVVANHFTSTHARSPFVGRPVVVRKDGPVIRRLLGRTLTHTTPDGQVAERELNDDELAETLRDDFDLSLPDQDVARLAAALRTSTAPSA